MQLLIAGALLCCIWLPLATSRGAKRADDNQIVVNGNGLARNANVPHGYEMPVIAARRKRPGRPGHRPRPRPTRPRPRPTKPRPEPESDYESEGGSWSWSDSIHAVETAVDTANTVWGIHNAVTGGGNEQDTYDEYEET